MTYFLVLRESKMAISWDTKTTNVNVVARRADVTFTREDSVTLDKWSVNFMQDSIVPAVRLALFDQAWAAWQTELTKRANVANAITNFEQAANANLMAREV